MYYGIESKDGSILVNEGYSYIEYVYNDYFIAKNEKGKLGVINANGKILIDFKYDFIQKVKNKNMIQILDKKTTYIYSNTLKEICKMKDANINNETGFMKIYNEKEEKYFDNDGNEISGDDEVIKETDYIQMPNNIGEYTKIQYSLEDVYYVKK